MPGRVANVLGARGRASAARARPGRAPARAWVEGGLTPGSSGAAGATASVDLLRFVQRTVGNQAVQRLLGARAPAAIHRYVVIKDDDYYTADLNKKFKGP